MQLVNSPLGGRVQLVNSPLGGRVQFVNSPLGGRVQLVVAGGIGAERQLNFASADLFVVHLNGEQAGARTDRTLKYTSKYTNILV